MKFDLAEVRSVVRTQRPEGGLQLTTNWFLADEESHATPAGSGVPTNLA